MALNLASGPRAQFIAWTAVAGAGLVAYITVKKRTNEKKRIDMQRKLAGEISLPADLTSQAARRSGGNVSSASAIRSQSSSSSSSSIPSIATSTSTSSSSSASMTSPVLLSSRKNQFPESYFLPSSMHETFAHVQHDNDQVIADYRTAHPPLSLKEYRQKMGIFENQIDSA